MFLAWGITGAGHFLLETFMVMEKTIKTEDVKVTSFLSSAGSEVVRMYGLKGKLREISPGGYYREILIENDEGRSAPRAGRLAKGNYGALIVSPASANTVAKIVYGFSDTLVTNAVAQAGKGGVPVYIVATDQERGCVETVLPHRVERNLCKSCESCLASAVCSYSAISMVEGAARIDLSKCCGCRLCIRGCPYGAVRFLEKVKVKVREIDYNNFKRLTRMKGITTLNHPKEIEEVVKKLREGGRLK